MKYGFVRVAAGTPEIKVADCPFNQQSIYRLMKEAEKEGADLLVLPELCLTGYTCGDLFLQKTLLDGAADALLFLAKASESLGLLTVVGAPLLKEGRLYNCAVVLSRGKILGAVPKASLPNYSEFYEQRHFIAAPKGICELTIENHTFPMGTDLLFRCSEMADFTLAIELCEDLWIPNPPSIRHAAAGATVIANLSASDETIGKERYRRDLVAGQSGRLVCSYIYADAGEGESTTDMVFAGHNLIAENGAVLSESKLFQNTVVYADVDIERLVRERQRMKPYANSNSAGYTVIPFSSDNKDLPLKRHFPMHPFVPSDTEDRNRRCELILTMQSTGLKKRLAHINSKTAVVGVSGGLDSCLALLVAVRAMDMLCRPRQDVLAVSMPCFGTTQRTRSNAQLLSESLGVSFRTIDITAAVRQHFSDIGQNEEDHSVTYENTQARERTQVLMDLANLTGGIVIGTGDLSELALGWATYNGDHMSMYGVNGSIPKTLVRHLVKYAADTAKDGCLRETLLGVLDTPVSPELLPPSKGQISQKTEDIVGPYELHDFFLYYMIRFGFSPAKIHYLAVHAFQGVYEPAAILKWLKVFYRRFFSQQFKRSCLPDGPKVGSIVLSPRGDWRMPSDASAALWLNGLESL